MNCKVCKKEFDPDNDFVEDTGMLEALNYFVNIETICSVCLYKMRNEIEVITNFMTAIKH